MPHHKNMHKEASTAKYIGVWILTSILVRIATLAVDTGLMMYARSSNIRYDDILGLVITSSLVSTLVMVFIYIGVYSYFKDINLKKVVPYIYVLGGLGLVLAFIMNTGSYNLYGSSKSDSVFYSLVSIVIVIGGMLFIGSKFKSIEDQKIRARIELQRRSTPVTQPTSGKADSSNFKTRSPSPSSSRTAITKKTIDNTDKTLLNDYPQAQTRIEYVTEISDAWSSISALPDQYKLIFLQAVESNSYERIESLINTIKASYAEASTRYKDVSLNAAYEEAVELGEEYAIEFEKVADALTDLLQPNEILEKVKSKVEKHAAPPEMEPLHKFLTKNSMGQMVKNPREHNVFVREENHPVIPNVKNYYVLQDKVEHKLLGFTELSKFLRELNN